MEGIPFLSKMVLLMADGFDIGVEPLSIQSATQPFLVSSPNALPLSIELCEIPPFV